MSFSAVLERLSKLENPYPGLRPFDASEAHLFFGRDQQVLDLLDRLVRNRFVAVLGLSGSGKSSLVRAGLIPALHAGRAPEPGLRWRVAVSRPAGSPFASLARSLSCAASDLRASSHGLIDYAKDQLTQGEGLFILIDQFEELFRYKDRAAVFPDDSAVHALAASEATAFIDLLLASTRSPLPIYVVITMRTDYLGDCAEFPEFPEALNESQYLVPRLTREQRRQAIEGPLGRVRISSALVEQILNDAGDEPDQLPILQHALMRTWSGWRTCSADGERPIQVGDYNAAGGFRGALNQHADELLNSPPALAEPGFVQIVFRRLTALGRGNRERRDPAQLSELWDLCGAIREDQRLRVNAIIDVFRKGEATFLTPRDGDVTPETYIDIAHESLIRNWKVLAEKWLPEEEKQARSLIELLDRARGWQAHEKEVLIGLDLTGAIEWESRRNRPAKWAEHYVGPGALEEVEAFLTASREYFDASEKRRLAQLDFELTAEKKLREAAEFMAKSERSSARRTKIFIWVLAVLLLGALGLAYTAWNQQKLAQSRELAATAQTLLSYGKRGEAFDQALKAASIDTTSEAREAVAKAFPQILLTVPGSQAVLSAVFSPDGKLILTGNFNNTATVWDAATRRQVATLTGHTGEVHRAVFSRDGQRVVTASYDHTARVWEPATGKLIAELKGHDKDVNTAWFSPDGRFVVTASVDKTARVWSAATGTPIAKLEGHGGNVNSAVFSPDGQRIVTASDDHTARVWAAATGQMLETLDGHQGPVYSAEFSLDGQRIVTASIDHTARVWNAVNGQLIVVLNGHAAEVNDAGFSPDGQRVVTASDDHTARVWNAATGQMIATLNGHAAEVNNAKFSLDGQRIVTASRDHTARVWNAADGEVIATLEGHGDDVGNAAFSPDGQRVVTASYDNTARVWNIAGAGRLIAVMNGHTASLNSAVFSPDGSVLATASVDKTARLWNPATGKQIAELTGHRDNVRSVAFSPDGKFLATAGDDHTARVWSVISGQMVSKLEGHAAIVYSATFSPDGKSVLTASADHTAMIWDAATGQAIRKLSGHASDVHSAAFSHDGQRVVTASADETALVWDVTTGRVISKLSGHGDDVRSATFSPDGQRVVTASADKTAWIWNAATGQLIAKLEGHTGAVSRAEFSPDGRRVVTASDDYTARLWDASTGQVLRVLAGHSYVVASAAFSLDGKRIVTASLDGTARVWNTADGQLIAKLDGDTQSVFSAAFSPDGQRVATASLDTTARISRIFTFDDIVRLLPSK